MARQKRSIRLNVIKSMKELGVHKKEYNETINIFVDMIHQYEVLTEQFENEGYQVEEEYTNAAGATNMRKKPILTAIEKLRVDIGNYSTLLCINPKQVSMNRTGNSNSSSLGDILERLDR